MKGNMRNNPVMILAIGLIVAMVACLLVGITKAPTITAQDFRYAATYKLDGETKTLEGVYHVDFRSVGDGIAPLERYYAGYYVAEPTAGEPSYHTIATKEDLELRVVFIFHDHYLMGDSLYDEAEEPYLAVYDEMGCEYVEEEYMEKFDAELLSWELPEPVDNTFVFGGLSILHTGSMTAMLLVALLTLVACLIFVKKDESVPYKALDKISLVLNGILGCICLPFVTLVISLMGIYVGGGEFFYQVDLCIPAIAVFAIAASVCLRRKGYTKSGFFVQFIGPVLWALMLLWEIVS